MPPLEMESIYKECVNNIDFFNKQYHAATLRSLEKYSEHNTLLHCQRHMSRRSARNFSAVNPHANSLWTIAVVRSFIDTLSNALPFNERSPLQPLPISCPLVTFTHQPWHFPDTCINFDLGKAKRMLRNALAGTNFIARFEPAVYRNENCIHHGHVGNLVSFHAHALCWGGGRAALIRRLSAKRERFRPSLGSESGLRIDQCKTWEDAARALAYIGKMPELGYRTVKRNGKITQQPARMTLRSRYNLFEFMKQTDLRCYWLAGGQGTLALKGARTRLDI